MTKEIFIDAINALREQHDVDVAISESLSSAFASFVGTYDNQRLAEQVFKLLRIGLGLPLECGPEYPILDDIDYFCHEIDFGRKWKPGCALDASGKELYLRTPEELWEVLQTYPLLNKEQKVHGSVATDV